MKQLLPFAVIFAALTLSSCWENTTSAEPEQHESRSVDLDKSERVRVELKMPSANSTSVEELKSSWMRISPITSLPGSPRSITAPADLLEI